MTALAEREWRLIREEARPGPVQMALDEVAAATAANGGPRTVRVYRWAPSTLSLGYSQDPETIDWEACKDAGIAITRRPTGGGAIYHDNHGDISYSVIAPADEVPGPLLECYELFCEPIFDAFDRMGVQARFAEAEVPAIHEPACYLRGLHPAHDVVAGDGRKISGNAQYRQRDAVIQHGSLTYERRVDRHCTVFQPSPSRDAFRDRVTSIRAEAGIERRRAVASLEAALGAWADANEGTWRDSELERARALATDKYEDSRWVRSGDAPADPPIDR